MYDQAMLIAQITDLHISTPGSANDRHFRTAEHLERAVTHLNELAPRPDVVLATGDLVERGEPEEYARLRAILDGLAMPLYVIPGNHDARGPLVRAFGDRGYLPRDGGFLHYTVEDWPVRLVALDTHVPGASGGRLCAERLAWLDARLGEGTGAAHGRLHAPPAVRDRHAGDGRDGPRGQGGAGRGDRPPSAGRGGTVRARASPDDAAVRGHGGHHLSRDRASARARPGAPSPRLAVVMEPPACMLHLWLGPEAGLVSHVSVIGGERPPFTVYDGAALAARRGPTARVSSPLTSGGPVVSDPDPHVRAWRVTLAGLCATLVGIGLARFAYTPLLPALITEGWFPASQAAYLGAANLAGYLAGALCARAGCARSAGAPRVLRGMMALVTAAFFACALPLSFAWFFLWRFAAGVAGGTLMVLAAPTVLPHVPAARRGLAGGAIFTGVGLGIMASGTVVPAAPRRRGSSTTWCGLGVLSLLLTALAWGGWPAREAAAPTRALPAARRSAAPCSRSTSRTR